MTTFIAIIVSLAVGFIAGALVYRRNARKAERAIAVAKAAEAKAVAELAKLRK